MSSPTSLLSSEHCSHAGSIVGGGVSSSDSSASSIAITSSHERMEREESARDRGSPDGAPFEASLDLAISAAAVFASK
jgi:hypothetical protein